MMNVWGEETEVRNRVIDEYAVKMLTSAAMWRRESH